MTTIFVENCLENGVRLNIVERFGSCAVHRTLKPGENARITLSPFKSIVVEALDGAPGSADLRPVWASEPDSDTWPSFLERRCG